MNVRDTNRLMAIHTCAKYGKPMSNNKKVMGWTRICTERRTDRQTDSYIPPPELRSRGYNNHWFLVWTNFQYPKKKTKCGSYVLTNVGGLGYFQILPLRQWLVHCCVIRCKTDASY